VARDVLSRPGTSAMFDLVDSPLFSNGVIVATYADT
jgi:hypothetical protein